MRCVVGLATFLFVLGAGALPGCGADDGDGGGGNGHLGAGTIGLLGVDPPQIPVGLRVRLRLSGKDFVSLGVDSIRLQGGDGSSYRFYDVTVHSETSATAVIDPVPHAEYYVVRLFDRNGKDVTRGERTQVIQTVVRPPRVSSVSPQRIPDTGGSILVSGRLLDDASEVVLERDSELYELVLKGGDGHSTRADVPAGIPPGRYKVRVVTPGGPSLRTPMIRITDSKAGVAQFASLEPDTVIGGLETRVRLRGANLSDVTEILLDGRKDVSLAASVEDDGSLLAWIPDDLPRGLYTVRGRRENGKTFEAPRLQLGVAAPSDECPDILVFDSTGYEIRTTRLKVRIVSGMLTYVRDRRRAGAMVVRPLGQAGFSGLSFDDSSIPDAFVPYGVSLVDTDFETRDGECVARQTFADSSSGASFDVEARTEDGSIRVLMPFSSPREDVYGVQYVLPGIDPDAMITLAGFAGCRFGRGALSQPRYLSPVWTTTNRILYESPQGGAIVIDDSRSEDANSHQNGFGKDSNGLWTHLSTRTRKEALRGDTLLDMSIEAPDRGFDDAFEPARAALKNPAPPEAKRPFALCIYDTNEIGSDGRGGILLASEIDAFEREEWGLDIPLEKRFAIYPAYTRNPHQTRFPDYDEPVDPALFGAPIAGPRLPFINAFAVQPASRVFEELDGGFLTKWNRDSGRDAPFIWDTNDNGVVDAPMDHYFEGFGWPRYGGILNEQLASLQDQVSDAVPGLELGGVYLDAASSMVREDRNPDTGSSYEGFREWAAAIRRRSSDPDRFILAGEAFTATLTRMGFSQQTRGLTFALIDDFQARPAASLGAMPHPAAAYVIGREGRGHLHYGCGGVADRPMTYYAARFLGDVTGVTPTLIYGAYEIANTAATGATGRRGVRTLLERGLYWARHDVEPHFALHPAWDDPDTGVILDVDGEPQVETRDRIRDRLVLDLWYHFGGGVPSKATFAKLRARVAPNIVSVMAITGALREKFARFPLPPEKLLSRPQAVEQIRSALGFDYPEP